MDIEKFGKLYYQTKEEASQIIFTILFMVFYDLIKDVGRIKRKYR